jgi:hypothetical protein
MIGVRPTDLLKFQVDLAAAVVVLEAQMAQKVDTFARKVYSEIILDSPQWSQNFASNWNYSVGSPDETYRQHPNKEDKITGATAFRRGAPPVVGAKLAELANYPALQWGQTAYFTNATPDEAGGYLLDSMEADGQNWLRPVNLVEGQVALINYAVANHSNDTLT